MNIAGDHIVVVRGPGHREDFAFVVFAFILGGFFHGQILFRRTKLLGKLLCAHGSLLPIIKQRNGLMQLPQRNDLHAENQLMISTTTVDRLRFQAGCTESCSLKLLCGSGTERAATSSPR
jgi:hypothetical protein